MIDVVICIEVAVLILIFVEGGMNLLIDNKKHAKGSIVISIAIVVLSITCSILLKALDKLNWMFYVFVAATEAKRAHIKIEQNGKNVKKR